MIIGVGFQSAKLRLAFRKSSIQIFEAVEAGSSDVLLLGCNYDLLNTKKIACNRSVSIQVGWKRDFTDGASTRITGIPSFSAFSTI